jgi:hypothetical protein
MGAEMDFRMLIWWMLSLCSASLLRHPDRNQNISGPEVHLGISWDAVIAVWGFVATVSGSSTGQSSKKTNRYVAHELYWGSRLYTFNPEEPEGHEMYDPEVAANQHKWFGPFHVISKDITDEDTQ